MKKALKIISMIMAVIMILSVSSTAFADSYNTAATAQNIGIGTTYTTFKYGYPDDTYKSVKGSKIVSFYSKTKSVKAK